MKLIGSHSLMAWGLRLSNHKAEYTGGFEFWSDEMQKYCEQGIHMRISHFTKDYVKSSEP